MKITEYLKRRRALRLNNRKGTVLLEFAIVLPLMLVFLMFVIDVSHLMLVKAINQEATFIAAQTTARRGQTGPVFVSGSTTTSDKSSSEIFKDIMANAPGVDSNRTNLVVTFQSKTGTQATSCRNNVPLVKAVGTSSFSTVIPGLSAALGLIGVDGAGSKGWNTLTVTSSAVVRCDIAQGS